jgi:hypothetical protein
VRARDIYVRTARTYWRRGGYLLLLGIAVFVPLGLLDAVADRIQAIRIEDLGGFTDLGTYALLAAIVAQAVTSLIGEIFYSGAVAIALARGEESKPPPFRTIAKHLSYGRLIVVDLIVAAGTALGLLLLVVPGLIFLTWFAFAGPIIELEGTKVRTALKRSRQLVRGHFWAVLLVIVPISIGSELLSTVSLDWFHELIHSHILSDWVGEAVTGIVLSPIYAVAVVLMTLQLSGDRGDNRGDVAAERRSSQGRDGGLQRT